VITENGIVFKQGQSSIVSALKLPVAAKNKPVELLDNSFPGCLTPHQFSYTLTGYRETTADLRQSD